MPSIYVHLSGMDVYAALLKLQGEEIEVFLSRAIVKETVAAIGRF